LKNIENENITSLDNLLKEGKKSIVIVTHENPDGDAIGSAIGLAEVLNAAGHETNIVSPNDYPSFLKWFMSDIKILDHKKYKRRIKNIIDKADLLICLDFNDPSRAGNLGKQIINFSNKKVVIDHHPNPVDFADYLISETSYSSTAELVFGFLRESGLDKLINKAAAEAFYTGIMTDTGSFSYGISDPNVFMVLASLMTHGIDVEKIQSEVYHNFSEDRMKLLGYCLNKKMIIYPEYRTGVIYITRDELKEYNFKPGDTEGFVNYPLFVNNIIFSALFIEKKNIIKASFRSKGNFPVNKFSSDNFNGGGHKNAAGGESGLTMDETVKKFRQLLEDYKHLLLETNN